MRNRALYSTPLTILSIPSAMGPTKYPFMIKKNVYAWIELLPWIVFLGGLCTRKHHRHLSRAANGPPSPAAAVASDLLGEGLVQLWGCQMVCSKGQCTRQALLPFVRSITWGKDSYSISFMTVLSYPFDLLTWLTFMLVAEIKGRIFPWNEL